MSGGGYNRNHLATHKFLSNGISLAVFLCLSAAGLAVASSQIYSNPVFADTSSTPASSSSLNLSVNIIPVISIRTLDSTATSEINSLDFNITPTSSGVRNTNTTVVDVSTSNVAGYKLYMESDYRTDGTSSTNVPGGNNTSTADFTTSLINTDNTIYTANPTAASIPTANTASANSSSYWNYSKSWNETLGTTGNEQTYTSTSLSSTLLNNLVIPTRTNPDTIRSDVDMATDSSKTNVDINVNIATDKVSGSYQNRLLFTAIANPIPVDYTLTFDKNTTDTVENLPSPLTASVVATQYSFIIPDTSGTGTTESGTPIPEMTREGYQLVGWSEDPNIRQGNGSGPDGLYVAGDTYMIVADEQTQPDYSQYGTGSATLYAVWALEYTYTLSFSCQSGVTNCPAQQTDTTTATSKSFTIPTTKPTLSNYDFVNYTDNGVGAGNTYNPGDTITLTSTNKTKTLTANFILSSYTLTVNPNGGTWNGSTSSQQFTQNYHTSKTLADPTAGPTYTISYNANGQGANYTASPTSVQRPFTSWSLSGAGTLIGSTYTFESGDGTVTAQYSTTSNSFTLPAITKTDYTCKWAEGSTSGTQYDGNTSRTVTGNKTYYAVCEADIKNSVQIGSYIYTTAVQSTSSTQSNAASLCNGLKLDGKSWKLPTQAQFNNAISTTAGKKAVYDYWGAGSYWSSANYVKGNVSYGHYYLEVTSATSSSASSYAISGLKYRVVCVQK